MLLPNHVWLKFPTSCTGSSLKDILFFPSFTMSIPRMCETSDEKTTYGEWVERLNNKTTIVVLDDVNDSDQIDFMGVKHLGVGSKIIVTSRDRQVLKNGGTDQIHEGAVSGISNLLEKCLLDIITALPSLRVEPFECISMHDMLEEMGKDIVRQEVPDSVVNLIKLEELCLRKSKVGIALFSGS
ncbi:hypothetical protein V6N13_038473 [Hibiscus sabdariffa]